MFAADPRDDDPLDLFERLDRLGLDLLEEQRRRRPCPDHLPEDYWSDYIARVRAGAVRAYELVMEAQQALAVDTDHDVFMNMGFNWR